MNQLSWLIYFAGVAGNFSTAFGVMLFVIFIAAGASGIGWITASAEGEKIASFLGKLFLSLSVFGFVVALIAAAIPSKETVYAIAASEIGEEVIANPRVMKTTNKAFDALDSWLDEQIKDSKEKKEEE